MGELRDEMNLQHDSNKINVADRQLSGEAFSFHFHLAAGPYRIL